jgi:pimeloyl-ACP methyl ester carboxylesterase
VDALELGGAVFVGWSLGGHVALEMAPDLPKARGFTIFGTPPLAFPPDMGEAFLPNPAMAFTFSEHLDCEQAAAYVGSFFKPGFPDVSPFFMEDVMRTDGRARGNLAASIAPGGARDEVEVVRDLKVPLAVLHGAAEQLVNVRYFASIVMPTLWRCAVQTIPGAGHTPQWETPQAFDALLAAFVDETA